MPVHRHAAILIRAGDQPGGRGAAHQELDGPLHVLGVLAARGRVAVGQERRARQAGHGHGIGLAAAGDPRAVVGLLGGQVIEPLDDGPDRLGRDVLGQDLLVGGPGRGERRPASRRRRHGRSRPPARAQEPRRVAASRRQSMSSLSRHAVSSLAVGLWDEPRTGPAARRARESPGTWPSPAACAAARRRSLATLVAGHARSRGPRRSGPARPCSTAPAARPGCARRRSPSRRLLPGACRNLRGRTAPARSWLFIPHR